MFKHPYDQNYEINDYLYNDIYYLTSTSGPLLQNECNQLVKYHRMLNKKRPYLQSESSNYEVRKEDDALKQMLNGMKDSGLFD